MSDTVTGKKIYLFILFSPLTSYLKHIYFIFTLHQKFGKCTQNFSNNPASYKPVKDTQAINYLFKNNYAKRQSSAIFMFNPVRYFYSVQ